MTRLAAELTGYTEVEKDDVEKMEGPGTLASRTDDNWLTCVAVLVTAAFVVAVTAAALVFGFDASCCCRVPITISTFCTEVATVLTVLTVVDCWFGFRFTEVVVNVEDCVEVVLDAVVALLLSALATVPIVFTLLTAEPELDAVVAV
jgi:hypothetical protein